MSLNIVRLTRFKVQRLQCIGGQRRGTPYRITTFRDRELGLFGEVAKPFTQASNAGVFKRTGWRGLERFLSSFSY